MDLTDWASIEGLCSTTHFFENNWALELGLASCPGVRTGPIELGGGHSSWLRSSEEADLQGSWRLTEVPDIAG